MRCTTYVFFFGLALQVNGLRVSDDLDEHPFHAAPPSWRGCDHGHSPELPEECQAAAAKVFGFHGELEAEVKDRALPPGCIFDPATQTLKRNLVGSARGAHSGTWRVLCDGAGAVVTDVGTVALDGLFLTQYYFGPVITPKQGDMVVYKGTLFAGWWRGGMDDRTLVLSRKRLGRGLWEHLVFDYRHEGFRKNRSLGDSHNNIALGLSPRDGSLHMLFDMHGSMPSDTPNYFNYIRSREGVDVSADDWDVTLFSDIKRSLSEGQEPKKYYKGTYPGFVTLADGLLVAKWRLGGSMGALMQLSAYDEAGWGPVVPWNDRNGSSKHYGEQGFYGTFAATESGRLFACWQRRTEADQALGWPTGRGLYLAAADGEVENPLLDSWSSVSGLHGQNTSKLPIGNWSDYFLAEPVPQQEALLSVPACDTNDEGAVHAVAALQKGGKARHMYRKTAGDEMAVIEIEAVQPQLHFWQGRAWLVSLDSYQRPLIRYALIGTNDWQTVIHVQGGPRYNHYSLMFDKGCFHFFGMERTHTDKGALHLMRFDLAALLGLGLVD